MAHRTHNLRSVTGVTEPWRDGPTDLVATGDPWQLASAGPGTRVPACVLHPPECAGQARSSRSYNYSRWMVHRPKLDSDALLDAFKGMTLIELSEFVKQFDETFAIVSTTPLIASGLPFASPDGTFYVALVSAGERKIAVIKEVRALTGLGLKEAKDLVDSGGTIGAFADEEEARRAITALESAGATAAILGEEGEREDSGAYNRHLANDELMYALGARLESMLTPSEIFRVLNSDDKALRTWRNEPQLHDAAVAMRLTSLLTVAAGFGTMWDDSLFAGWLFAPNAHLDGATPADLVTLGKSPLVLTALEDAAFGVYA